MISYDFLKTINDRLTDYRSQQRKIVIHDDRDHGNFSDYEWPRTFEMLKTTDLTGLSAAMLIHEKIEATIKICKVNLERVLLEDGYLESLREILATKAELGAVLQGPMMAFKDRIETMIGAVSKDFGEPTTREVAVCLRDAIYSINKGMKLRWLQCEHDGATQAVGLHSNVVLSPSLADFVQELKNTLPFGIHVGRIGTGTTAIGIKKPGRIAYLSSLYIDLHTGKMAQSGQHDAHMKEKLDLDGYADRYPDWVAINHSRQAKPGDVDTGTIHISELSRDRMIWLAMIIELSNQEMARANPADICLTESARSALSHDSATRPTLPVPYKPSWTLELPKLEDVYATLEFSEWENKFLADALVGVNPEFFMPFGEDAMSIHLKDKTQIRYPKDNDPEYDWFQAKAITENCVKMTAISNGIAGTKEEVEGVIFKIYQHNLAEWLMEWGNDKFETLWENDTEWFKKRLAKNAEKALSSHVASIKPIDDFHSNKVAKVFKQSPKHKEFKAVCYFRDNVMADVKGHLYPKDSKDLVEILGLKNEAALPDYLHGWSRTMGWRTADGYDSQASTRPTRLRWIFSDRTKGYRNASCYYEGQVYFNHMSHPLGRSATIK
jgi:hypothetical protein